MNKNIEFEPVIKILQTVPIRLAMSHRRRNIHCLLSP